MSAFATVCMDEFGSIQGKPFHLYSRPFHSHLLRVALVNVSSFSKTNMMLYFPSLRKPLLHLIFFLSYHPVSWLPLQQYFSRVGYTPFYPFLFKPTTLGFSVYHYLKLPPISQPVTSKSLRP